MKFMFSRNFVPKMVPTVCVEEFPMAPATVTSRTRRRRRRRSQNGTKWRRYTSEDMLRTGTIVETLLSPSENCPRRVRRLGYADTAPVCPDYPVAYGSGEHPMNAEDHRRLVAERRKGKRKMIIDYDMPYFISDDYYFR